MKLIKLFAILLIPFALFAQEISITVYNNNLGVIRDKRVVNLKNGISELRISDVAKLIDPTSVHVKLNGNVLEQNYQYDLVSLSKILNKYVEKHVQLIDDKGNLIEGTLLSAQGNQLVIQSENGGLTMIPNTDEYKISVGSLPDGLITKPTLVWLVDSKQQGNQDLNLEYQTRGMNWHAEYVAVLNEKDNFMDLNSWVSIENNSGTSYKNAKLKLIAGDIHRANEVPRSPGAVRKLAAAQMEMDNVSEKAFFEYHLYEIERPTTLANNETKQISLFNSENIKINKKYLYVARNGDSENGKAKVLVEFKNSGKNNLGIPLPKGKVRVYKDDGESVEFIGEDLIDHTPKNENLKLTIGEAFDIRISEKSTSRRKISDRVFEESFEFEIRNSKDENIIVNIDKYLPGDWKIKNANFNYEKLTSNKIEFKVPVKANDKTKLTLSYRYSY